MKKLRPREFRRLGQNSQVQTLLVLEIKSSIFREQDGLEEAPDTGIWGVILKKRYAREMSLNILNME